MKGNKKVSLMQAYSSSTVPTDFSMGRISMRLANSSILLLLLFLFSGCYLRPNFGPPGTIGMQRSRAVLHDPYPSNELGPPILGGRPLGFDRPQAEAENLQEVRSSLFNSVPTNNIQAFPANAPPVQPSIQQPIIQQPIQ